MDFDESRSGHEPMAPSRNVEKAIGFQCNLCPVDFDTKRDLKWHTKQCHEKPTNRVIMKRDEYYQCHIC